MWALSLCINILEMLLDALYGDFVWRFCVETGSPVSLGLTVPGIVWKHSRWTGKALKVLTPADRSPCPLVLIKVTTKPCFPQLSFLPVCSLLLLASNVLFLFLFFLGRSPQWFLPTLGGELPVTIYIIYKVANIRPGISYPASNIGQLVTHAPSEVQGYHWTQNKCAYLKLKCICSFQNSVSPFQDGEGPGNGMSLLVSSLQGLLGKILAVASLFS